MPKKDFYIERMSPQNLNDVETLFRSVFGIVMTIDQIKKKYKRTNEEWSYTGYLAYSPERKPIGFCGGIPCRIKYKNELLGGMQFCDSMTEAEWRGNEIFKKLGQKLELLAIDLNLLFHYGFLNQFSYWAYQKKLDWKIIGEMERFELFTWSIPLYKIGQHVKFIHQLHQKWINKRLMKVTDKNPMPNSIKEKDKVTVFHDADFYNNKQSPPHFFIKVLHSKVWLRTNPGCWVGDMELHEADHPKEVVERLKRKLFFLGFSKVNFHVQINTLNHKKLKQYYNCKRSWHLGAKSYNPSIPIDDLVLCLGDIDTF